jgi:hypothetical protein
MCEWNIRVIIGLTDHTWKEMWVKIPYDAYPDRSEAKERAEGMVSELVDDDEVDFIKAMTADEPLEPMDGII